MYQTGYEHNIGLLSLYIHIRLRFFVFINSPRNFDEVILAWLRAV
jgi:hypothetical protein